MCSLASIWIWRRFADARPSSSWSDPAHVIAAFAWLAVAVILTILPVVSKFLATLAILRVWSIRAAGPSSHPHSGLMLPIHARRIVTFDDRIATLSLSGASLLVLLCWFRSALDNAATTLWTSWWSWL
jgi:hypothetical protein